MCWLRSRNLEIAIFVLGMLLRASMAWSYRAGWGYDADGHWAVVEWMLAHRRVAPPDAALHAFHPPLYYATAAWLTALGVSREGMVWVSIVCGTLRLALIWAGLELFLANSRPARVAGLTLAAVLAGSVHPDGMVYSEAMNGMWLTAAMLLVPLAFRRAPRSRWWLCCLIGLLLGVSMLTKISGLVVLASVACAVMLELAFSRRTAKRRLMDLLAWAGAPIICLAVCGWYFAGNVRAYGRPFITSFDLPTQHPLIARYDEVPALERRSLGYVFAWDPAITTWPFYPVGIEPYPRFLPVAIASTFTDYWNFSFSGIDPTSSSTMKDWSQNRPVSEQLLAASRQAVLGGIAISAATVIAWFFAASRLFRRRDFGRLSLVLVPAVTFASALHFATFHPVDSYGVVKGIYMQFGAPPMYALFGLSVAWARRERGRWPVFAALCLALWFVAGYTLWCRLRVPIIPLG